MLARLGLAILLMPAFAVSAEIQHNENTPTDETYEADFKKLVAGGDAKIVRERYLNRLLQVRYRTEYYLEAFEAELQQGRPLSEMDSYENLLATHPVRDSADDEAVYIYRRVLEIANNPTEQNAEVKTSLRILGEIFDWIRERPEEDRLMISDWIDRMEETARESAGLTSGNDKPKKKREIASTFPTLNYAEYNFGNQDNLSRIFKKHKDEIKESAKASLKWKDKELEDTLALYKSARGPKSREVAGLSEPMDISPPKQVTPHGPQAAKHSPVAPHSPVVPRSPTAPHSPTSPRAQVTYRPGVGREGSFDGEHMFPQNLAFTFDDGPHPQNTDRVIEIASSYRDSVNTSGVPLTFFWLEIWASKYPQQIEHAKAHGILMNNHSWTHMDFGRASAAPYLRHEIVEANAALKQNFGVQPVIKSDSFPYFRCPYGACVYAHHFAGVPEARKMIADLGLIHILWNIDSTDWANTKNPERTRDITIAQLERTENGVTIYRHGVILMHDIKPRTPDAFRMVLDWIKQKNEKGAHFTLVSVATGIAQANGQVSRAN